MIVVMSIYAISQIVGVLAVIFALSIYQLKKRESMLKTASLAAVLFAIHFLLIGAYTGAAMNIVGAMRNFVYSKFKTRKYSWVAYVFLLLAIGMTIFTWQGWSSLFAMGATGISCIALWQQDPKLIRKLMLLVPPMWFVYAVVSGSYPVMFVEIAIFCSNIIGQYRFDHRHLVTTHRHVVRHA